MSWQWISSFSITLLFQVSKLVIINFPNHLVKQYTHIQRDYNFPIHLIPPYAIGEEIQAAI